MSTLICAGNASARPTSAHAVSVVDLAAARKAHDDAAADVSSLGQECLELDGKAEVVELAQQQLLVRSSCYIYWIPADDADGPWWRTTLWWRQWTACWCSIAYCLRLTACSWSYVGIPCPKPLLDLSRSSVAENSATRQRALHRIGPRALPLFLLPLL